MPKTGKRAPQETRKQQVRRARERRQERVLYLGLGGVALIVLLVLGFGYYRENIGKLDGPIASVNGAIITVRDYQTRIRYDSGNILGQLNSLQSNLNQIGNDPSTEFLKSYIQQQQTQLTRDLLSLPHNTLENLIDDELVRQEAAKRNVVASADEIDEEIEREFGYQRATPTPTLGPSPTATLTGTPTRTPTITPTRTRTPTPTGTGGVTPPLPTTPTITPTPGPTETPFPTATPLTYQGFLEQKKKFLDSLNNNVHVSEAEFRKLIETSLLRRKFQDVLSTQVPTTAEQVQARHILVKTYAEAVQVEERLKKGEDFAKLAQELSTDTGSKDEGGDLGWFARGQMIKEFEDAAFSLPVNQISQPVTTTFGVHIIQALGHEQNRPLDASALRQKQNAALNDWLEQTRLTAKIERFYRDDYVPPEIRRAITQTERSVQ